MYVPDAGINNKLSDDREYLVLDNLNLVDWIIQKYLHISPLDPFYEDYQQEGRYGLVKAAIAFDESKGYKFSTLASTYIVGYAKRFRRDFVRSSLKVSRRIVDIIPKVMSLYYEGYSYNEICNKLDLSSEEISDVLNVSAVVSMDQSVKSNSNDKDELILSDMIGSPDSSITDVLGDEIIEQAIETVADSYRIPLHREVWYEYIYPALFGERVTNKSIAIKYGISQSNVNRILNKGKKRLMEELKN